jgi:hypothetical protein
MRLNLVKEPLVLERSAIARSLFTFEVIALASLCVTMQHVEVSLLNLALAKVVTPRSKRSHHSVRLPIVFLRRVLSPRIDCPRFKSDWHQQTIAFIFSGSRLAPLQPFLVAIQCKH